MVCQAGPGVLQVLSGLFEHLGQHVVLFVEFYELLPNDPEDLREVISSYQKCVAEAVQRFGGFVAKYMGDGVLVYFGYPQAHEDAGTASTMIFSCRPPTPRHAHFREPRAGPNATFVAARTQ